MRLSISILFIFIFLEGYPAVSDSTNTGSRTIFSGSLSINSNGIASIPAFSLGKPALIASLSVQKKRFSYDPVVAYGLNFRPWVIDNWLHYRPIFRPKFELRAGFNFSMFFCDYKPSDVKILQGQQYLTAELAGVFRFKPGSSLTAMIWSDNGQDQGSIKGFFYNVVYDRTDLPIGKSMLFSANVQLFYIDYTGLNDGLFLAPRLAVSKKEIPIALFFQFTQQIVTNIVPSPGFKWNAGAGYLF
jgi:hypothetical protein